MRRLFCAFLAFLFCTVALSAECPIGYTLAQYIQLEYIQSTGTQYIDTGITGNNILGIKIKYAYTTSGSSAGICGIYQGTAPRTDTLFISTRSGLVDNTNMDLFHRGAIMDNLTKPILNEIYESSVNYMNDGIINFNNGQVTMPVGLNDAIARHIPIFGRENNGTIKGSACKIYYCKMTESSSLLCNLIPAMRLGDGKPGMYDTVSGQFFTNAGTGEFIMGPEVQTEFMNFNECVPCPPNTYKDFVGDGECTPCPDTLISPSGSKSVSECGRVLHIGDKIYHLKSVKQTSPSLHIRDENGNVWYGNLYSEQE